MFNEGWPGEKIDTGLSRLPDNIAHYGPDFLLLLHGANDLLNDPSEATVDHIVNRTRDMIRVAKSARRDIVVLLANFPPQFIGTPVHRGAGAGLVVGLNAKLADVALSEGIILVDLYTPMNAMLKQSISLDGLHPTQQGYAVVASAFLQTIQRTIATGGVDSEPEWP